MVPPRPHSEVDSSTHKLSALRILAGDRKILIFRKIKEYDRLCEILEEQMRAQSKPLKTPVKRTRIG